MIHDADDAKLTTEKQLTTRPILAPEMDNHENHYQLQKIQNANNRETPLHAASI